MSQIPGKSSNFPPKIRQPKSNSTTPKKQEKNVNLNYKG
jgi:hypothetical protein